MPEVRKERMKKHEATPQGITLRPFNPTAAKAELAAQLQLLKKSLAKLDDARTIRQEVLQLEVSI